MTFLPNATTARRAAGAATALAATLLLAACAKVVEGTGEASDEIEALTSMTADEIADRLPDEDFYGIDVSIQDDPADPFRGLCIDITMPEAEDADADTVVRYVDGDPDEGLAGTGFLTDETVYVFTDVGTAKSYHEDALKASAECPSEEDSYSDGNTYTYSYETGDLDVTGWQGQQITMETTVDDGDDPYENAEIRAIAQRGNAVVYISWLVHRVDDMESAQSTIADQVAEYLQAVGGGGA